MTHVKHHRPRWTAFAAAAATLLLASAGVSATRLATAAADGGTLAVTAGCGTAPTLISGTHSIQSGGQSRSYILRIPDNYDNAHPYRLIFGFHWLGGTAADVANGNLVQPYYGLQALSNNSAIFVAPQGLDNGWANTNGRDVTFVDDMIEQLKGDLCIDTTELFSLGFSYGGGMSYALACARATVFRAVAIYSGGVISECSGGTQPIAYLQAHGISDQVLPISGARTMRDTFAGNNGCTAASPPEPAAGSGTHTSFTYSGCSAGYPVAWYAFDGGHTPVPTDANGSPWLPGQTWAFFTQFETPTPPTTGTAPPTSSAPPTVTPTVTPTATPTSTGTATIPAATCTATYTEVASWPGGFQAEVTVTSGESALDGWSVGLTVAAGTSVTQVWNGVLSGGSPNYTVRNQTYNGTLAPGSSTSFGMLGTGAGAAATVTCTSP